MFAEITEKVEQIAEPKSRQQNRHEVRRDAKRQKGDPRQMCAQPADPVMQRFVWRIGEGRDVVPVEGQLREQQQRGGRE
jgi:hypothetical protein